MATIKTAEQIAEETGNKNGIANIRAINRAYRAQDESRLYPINGKFNATNRAINRVRRLARHNGAMYGLEYCLVLENALNAIVNSAT